MKKNAFRFITMFFLDLAFRRRQNPCQHKLKKRKLLIVLLTLLGSIQAIGQSSPAPEDSLSKFDSFNKKAQALFKVIPVPIISYSTEAGNTFGLAKFNAFHPVKKDTISKPSKISEVATFSTKGRVNVSVSNDLILKENKYMILSFFNYKKQPEYMLGIGNEVSRDDVEQVITNRIKFSSIGLMQVKNSLYVGIGIDIANYFGIKADSNSFLIEDNVAGLSGGTDVGIGLAVALDSRDNRYNPSQGAFLLANFIFYPNFLGSTYQFGALAIDARKYFNPWHKHVIAVQAATNYTQGDVPFYDLSMLGGEDRMRGYYKGALRDKVLFDTQVEYRMPIWKVFGVVGWVGTGRVADAYKNLNFDGNGFWLSYGGGLRIQVDGDNNINLRVDMGFGPGGISGLYLNFAEAF